MMLRLPEDVLCEIKVEYNKLLDICSEIYDRTIDLDVLVESSMGTNEQIDEIVLDLDSKYEQERQLLTKIEDLKAEYWDTLGLKE